jgi:hypothetical protein
MEDRNKNPIPFKSSSYDSSNNDLDNKYIQASQSSLSSSNITEIIREDFCDVNTR